VAYGLRSKSAGAPGWAGGVIRNLGAGGAGTRAAGGVMAGGLCGGEAKSVWLRLRGGGVERKGPQTDDEAAEEVARCARGRGGQWQQGGGSDRTHTRTAPPGPPPVE